MIRALIIIKAANLADARQIAQGAPFHVSAETAEDLFEPANEVLSEDGQTVITPATMFWASGQFTQEHYDAMSAQAAGLDWAFVDAYSLDDAGFPTQRLAQLQGQSLFAARKR